MENQTQAPFSPFGEQVKPPIILYHKSSPDNRASIRKYGLLTAIGKSYDTHIEGEKLPAVFANTSSEYDTTFDDDIWEINTNVADVRWFIDMAYNNVIDLPGFNDLPVDKGMLCSDQIVPPSALMLIHQGSGVSTL